MTKVFIGALALLLAACGSSDEVLTDEVPTVAGPAVTGVSGDETSSDVDDVDAIGCADVIDATIELGSTGFNFDVTVSSADTGWDKYADAWVVRGPEGEVLGERVLTHPHENEQPFTRSLSDVIIPSGVDEITIAARDSVLGFCGSVVVLEVPRS